MLIQIETLHTLSVLFFASICRISWVLTSANGKFFEFLNSAPKKNTVEPRDIRLFLSRSTEKQAGHHSYWLIIDLLLIDSKTQLNYFYAYFFCAFREIWILCIFSMYLSLRVPLKRKFCVYFILRNWPKFAKKIYTRKLVQLR